MLPLDPEAPPLRLDDTGTVRVGATRIQLDTVVLAFLAGDAPEQIVRSYDSLRLDEVYAVITYYLRHRPAVDDYLARRKEEAKQLRAEIEAAQRHLPDIRGRILREREARRRAPESTAG